MNQKFATQKGDFSEAYLIAHFIQLGWRVLKPINSCLPYDLLIDRGNGFERVQVKHGRLQNNIVKFNCYDNNNNNYIGRADLIAVFLNNPRKFYLIPVNMLGKKGCLEFKKTQNNKKLLAINFEI